MKNKIVIIILLVLAFLIVISAVGYTYNLSFIGKIVSEETRKKIKENMPKYVEKGKAVYSGAQNIVS